MTIEFQCHDCGRAMRAPDGAAGKQGKCPQCGTVMTIPTPELEAPQAVTTADGKIEFPCPSCAAPVRTPAAAAGKRGKCPHCGEIMQIPTVATEPAAQEAAEEEAAPPVRSTPATAKSPTAGAGSAAKAGGAAGGATEAVEFPCPSCQHRMRAPAFLAGKNAKCPRCENVVKIPGGATAEKKVAQTQPIPKNPKSANAGRPAAPAKAAPAEESGTPAAAAPVMMLKGLRPIGASAPTAAPNPAAGLTPISAPTAGLTPISSPTAGLTPLPSPALGGGLAAASPFDTGLTPHDPAAAAPANAFGELGGAPGFGASGFGAPGFGAPAYGAAPAGALNPYAAPSVYGYGGGGGPQVSTYGGTPSGGMEFGAAFSRTWALFSANFVQAALLSLAFFGILIGLLVVLRVIVWACLFAGIGLLAIVIQLGGMVGVVLVAMYLGAGMVYACMRCARTGVLDVSDLWSGGGKPLAFLGTQFLTNLASQLPVGMGYMIGFAFIMLQIPKASAWLFLLSVLAGSICGMIVGVKLTLAPYLVLDGKRSFGDSFAYSWNEMTFINSLVWFGVIFCASMLCSFVIIFTCGFGVLMVVPYMILMTIVLYQQVADSRK